MEKYNFPTPLATRETYVNSFGVDRLDRNGSVVIISRSIHDRPHLAQKYGITIPEKTKNVKFDLHYTVT